MTPPLLQIDAVPSSCSNHGLPRLGIQPLNVGVMIGVWVYRQFAMAIMSLTTGMAEFVFLILLLWRTVWSLWGAVTGLMADRGACDRVKGRVLV